MRATADPGGRERSVGCLIDYHDQTVSRQSDRFTALFGHTMRPVHWIVLSLGCLALDYWAGPQIQFPIAYLVPISLASWYGGRTWGLALAAILPLFRLLYYLNEVWDPPASLAASSINAGIRVAVFALVAWLIDRTAYQVRELRRMRMLEGLLGVCSECKHIHDQDRDAWEALDVYLAGHPGEFKPGICPACAGSHTGVFDRR